VRGFGDGLLDADEGGWKEWGKKKGGRKEEERGASLYIGQGCHPHWLVPLSSSGVGVGEGGRVTV
jgi:hypothetical protein